MLLITLYREGQMQRDKKRAEHEYNPNANLKKKKILLAKTQIPIFLLLFKRKCWNVGTNSKDACDGVTILNKRVQPCLWGG